MHQTPSAAAQDGLLQQIIRACYELQPVFEQHMGMTRARWHLLKQLLADAPLSQTALQQRACMDGAAVSRQVKHLEEAGLVERRVDPHDNRITLVWLTAAGRELVGDLLERRACFEARATQGISAEELQITQRCLRRIRANLTAACAPEAPQNTP